jgi:hypothetical protein
MGRTKIASFQRKSYKNLQLNARKIPNLSNEIIDFGIVQAERSSWLTPTRIVNVFCCLLLAQLQTLSITHDLCYGSRQKRSKLLDAKPVLVKCTDYLETSYSKSVHFLSVVVVRQ